MSAAFLPLWPAVANHLWQSTIFAAMIALVAWLLRHNIARVRYGLWLAASIKFLVPFSLLVALGGVLPKSQQLTERSHSTEVVAQAVAEPFSVPEPAAPVMEVASSLEEIPSGPEVDFVRPMPAPLPPARSWRERIEMIGVTIWLCGVVVVLATWLRRWRQVAALQRAAVLAREGRELEILQCMDTELPLLLSQERMEPGVFGIFRQVLVWPQGLSNRLTDDHIEAILAHELEHVRRRDNLTAALHMVVEAAFWFHPAVWWMERRLVEERERACDEAVVGRSADSETYAEGLLRACRFCVEVPLVCVAGITGADLNRRIRSIMAQRWQRLSWIGGVMLTVLAVTTLGAPLLLGQMRASLPQIKPLQFLMAPVQVTGDVLPQSLTPSKMLFALTHAATWQDSAIPAQTNTSSPGLKTGLQIVSDVHNVDFGPYLKALREAIRQSWISNLPADVASARLSGVTALRITILPDGQIGALVVETKSGNEILDRAAWSAVTSLGKMPALPKEFPGVEITIRAGFFANTDTPVGSDLLRDGGNSEELQLLGSSRDARAIEEQNARTDYANQHFGTPTQSGITTDRGKVYFQFGRPDSVDSAPGGQNPVPSKGPAATNPTVKYLAEHKELLPAGSTAANSDPWEEWHYANLRGKPVTLDVTFVDRCRCGQPTITHVLGRAPGLVAEENALTPQFTERLLAYVPPDGSAWVSWGGLMRLVPGGSIAEQPAEVRALDGKNITISGYPVPLAVSPAEVQAAFERLTSGRVQGPGDPYELKNVTKILLVPSAVYDYRSMALPENAMIYVELKEPLKAISTNSPISVSGAFRIGSVKSGYGTAAFSMSDAVPVSFIPRRTMADVPNPYNIRGGLPVPNCDPHDPNCGLSAP